MCARSKMHAFNNWKLEKKNLDLDQGNRRQRNGMDKRTPEQRYIYRERYISRVKATCKQKSCQGDTQTKVMSR